MAVLLISFVLLQQDAMTFPLIGSAVLLGLFLLFKFLPQDLINTILASYFVLIGIVAITVTISPFIAASFPKSSRKRSFKLPKFTVPYLLKVTSNAPLKKMSICLQFL